MTAILESQEAKNKLQELLNDPKIKNTTVKLVQNTVNDVFNQFYLTRKSILTNMGVGAGVMGTGWYLLPCVTSNTNASVATTTAGAGVFGWNVKRFVNSLFHPPSRNQEQVDLLVSHVTKGDLAQVQNIVGYYLDVNAPNKSDWTPLQAAAYHEHITVLNFLLDAGANVDLADKEERTPLYLAAMNGKSRSTEVLLKAGADINDGGQHGTPLWIAASEGNLESGRLLVRESQMDLNKAHPGARTTPMQAAQRRGHHRFADLLRNAGARDIDAELEAKRQRELALARAREEERIATEIRLGRQARERDEDREINNHLKMTLLRGASSVASAAAPVVVATAPMLCTIQ